MRSVRTGLPHYRGWNPMARRANTTHNADADAPSGDNLIPVQHVRTRAGGISRTTVWRLVQAGAFPVPVQVGGRTLWSEREIDAWIAARKAAR